ncbi:hypothetical protein FACS189492_1670 [Clostridia bacterium]|nr:hypothetical protein FACS189492_1670 [Clostridia bacterium]
MFKKIALITGLAILLALTASGCGKKAANDPKAPADQTEQTQTQTEQQQQEQEQPPQGENPQDGKRQDGEPQRRITNAKLGQIQAIDGNDLTVLLFDLGMGKQQGGDAPQTNTTPEVSTITVTNSVKIYKPVYGNGAASQTAIKLSDLSVGDSIMVAYDDDGAKVVSIQLVDAGNRQ